MEALPAHIQSERRIQAQTALVIFTPRNIDLLNIGNPCNQNCRQCFAVENCASGKLGKATMDEEINLGRRIIKNYPASSIFVYPKEATTSKELVGLAASVGQKYLLTNGKTLCDNPDLLIKMKESGMERIKFTLFPNEEEQYFWNGNSPQEYLQIKEGIRLSSAMGLIPEVYTMLTPLSICQLGIFYQDCQDLGVSRINLLRLVPVGNGADADEKYILKEKDLEELLIAADRLKKSPGPYLSFGIKFGPDFYGNSIWKYLGGQKNGSWVATKTICPAINSDYAGISMKSKDAYWCFFLMSEPEAKIGILDDDGLIRSTGGPDLSADILKRKLRGNCSSSNCEFQGDCLGGCRSMAYLMAKRNGEAEPIYAGADICITQTRKKMKGFLDASQVAGRLNQGGNQNDKR